MGNYEYIIASLPALPHGGALTVDAQGHIKALREQLSAKDNSLVDTLLSGYEPDNLTPEFYEKMLSHRDSYIRRFFEFDLNLRNAKVSYLNRHLHRPAGQDRIELERLENSSFDEMDEVNAALDTNDILKRERALDDVVWHKVDDLTVLNFFDIDVILGYISKLMIIDRWNKLDPQTGRELFRKLVEEIRSTYDNKKNNMI